MSLDRVYLDLKLCLKKEPPIFDKLGLLYNNSDAITKKRLNAKEI